MNFLDIRSILITYGISSAFCATVMGIFWRQNRKRFKGLGFWVADFILQFVALMLIAFRGILPDFISVLLGTPLVLAGSILLFIGLERYTAIIRSQLHNYILLAVVFLVQGYFTFVQPSLQARNILFSLGVLAVCSQCAWLLMRRVNSSMLGGTKSAGVVFLSFCLVSIVRICTDLIVPGGNDLFQSGLYDTLAILIYEMLFIGLIFSLILMVNRRLTSNLEEDIVERKLAEERNANLAAIVESSDDAIIGKTLDGVITSWNKGAERIYGYSKDEIIGKTVTLLSPPEKEEEIMGFLERVKSGEYVDHFETIRRTKNGQDIIMSITISPVRDAESRIVAASTIGRDITERNRGEEKIKAYSEKLEGMVDERTLALRLAQEKLVRQEKLAMLGQLSGSVSHELRNPLGIISNAVYFLNMAQPNADAVVRKYLNIIENETRRADKIISDLLDYSRIKSINREPVVVNNLVMEVLERYPVPQGVNLELKIPEELTPAYADPHHLAQVLGNLVLNAYQAMADTSQPDEHRGELSISGWQAGTSDDTPGEGPGYVAIAVKDSGVGIPAENVTKLFEPLFTTKARGIGLGLAICKSLVEATGGRIEVESEPGQGSTFTVYLPSYTEVL